MALRGGDGSAQPPGKGGKGGSREPPTGGATTWTPVGDTWLDFPVPWIYCWAVYLLGEEEERLGEDIPEWDLPTIFELFPRGLKPSAYNLRELVPPKGMDDQEETQKLFLFIAQAVSGAAAKKILRHQH